MSKKYTLGQTIEFSKEYKQIFANVKTAQWVKSVRQVAIKYINAFLNGEGGIIYFGVDAAGKVVGIPIADKNQQTQFIENIQTETKKFRPSVEKGTCHINFVSVQPRQGGEHAVIKIQVSKGQSLHLTDSGTAYQCEKNGKIVIFPADAIHEKLKSHPVTQENFYTLFDKVKFDEDHENEFKALQSSNDPINAITLYSEKYINAFLNGNGGTIYFGIEDDGTILGVPFNRGERDSLRINISKIIHSFYPTVEPGICKVDFVEVQGRESAYVVEIHVIENSQNLYMTKSQKAWMRRNASNHPISLKMTIDWLNRLRGYPAQADSQLPSVEYILQSDTSSLSNLLVELRKGIKIQKEENDADFNLGVFLAMIYMSWQDKSLAEQELQLIQTEIDNQNLNEEELNTIRAAMFKPPTIQEMAMQLPTHESRKLAVTAAYLVTLADNALTIEELHAFDNMCRYFNISLEEQESIHLFGNECVRLSRD